MHAVPQPTTPPAPDGPFGQHRGEMAERIRAFDWATTPLGPIEWWPQSLKNVVDTVLASPDSVSSMRGPERPHRLVEVTKRFRAATAMRGSSRRLDSILNHMREAVFLMDHRQQCVYANAAAQKLTGYRFEEMRSRPLHDVVHHKRPDGTRYPIEECPIERAFPECAQTSGEELFVHKDGSFYQVAFTASPLLDEAGHPIGTVIEARNIAEEKPCDVAVRELNEMLERRVEEALAAQREADTLYRAHFENAPEALFVIAVEPDGGFTVERINPAHEATVGIKLEDMLGKRPEEILPGPAAERVIESYRRVVETGETHHYREVFEIVGGPQHWDTSLVPVR